MRYDCWHYESLNQGTDRTRGTEQRWASDRKRAVAGGDAEVNVRPVNIYPNMEDNVVCGQFQLQHSRHPCMVLL